MTYQVWLTNFWKILGSIIKQIFNMTYLSRIWNFVEKIFVWNFSKSYFRKGQYYSKAEKMCGFFLSTQCIVRVADFDKSQQNKPPPKNTSPQNKPPLKNTSPQNKPSLL